MDEVWAAERAFWLEGPETAAKLLHDACLMAFAGVGVLRGAASILQSLAGAPRWAELEISEEAQSRPADDLVVLAYRARARRQDAPPYEAWCTSVWRRETGAWRIVQHQQTPA